ncbi:formate dehydrogenase subunit gamma [Desulfothermobacter acidiphilus]|uniref:formate dehydrogenase subunit gamma n=1 Tax=Desulfothermobacter acidiphilus TaxID=1938353 RepID=UPI003F88A3C7
MAAKAKKNSSSAAIDLTPYDFIGFGNPADTKPTCASCHPGGAGLEYDRKGNRYDFFLKAHPQLSQSLDGDYFQSSWNKSGVVEADCLICHYSGYNWQARTQQLKLRNYKWAATVGAGLGQVTGAVAQGNTPRVEYDKKKFNPDGTVSHAAWVASPAPGNCLFCHGISDQKKRGFSWGDKLNPDIHQQRGLNCTTCHFLVNDPAKGITTINHQIAMGDDLGEEVAPELRNTVYSCRECHEKGIMGAPRPRHSSIPPNHLQRLTCEACHIPQVGRAPGLAFDVLSGTMVDLPLVGQRVGEAVTWQPQWFRHPRKGMIQPVNILHPIWLGNRDADGIIYPLFFREIQPVWERLRGKVNTDKGAPVVATEEEIRLLLVTSQQVLTANPGRFKQIHPVYFKAGKVWELDANNNLRESKDPNLEEPIFCINHNVSPAGMALGAKGCSDCHSRQGKLYQRIVVDPFGLDGQPVTVRQASLLGWTPLSFSFTNFYLTLLSPLFVLLLVGLLLAMSLHYVIVGPRGTCLAQCPEELELFALDERVIHLVRMLSFIFLAVTGLLFAFHRVGAIEFLFGSYEAARVWHWSMGLVFGLSSLWAIVRWWKDCRFAPCDREWLRVMGGYLSRREVHAPAGKFNAGQKLFYWLTTVFTLTIGISGVIMIFGQKVSPALWHWMVPLHGISALVLILAVIGHAYLGTLANPGTWRLLVTGKVSPEWARAHHPLWYEGKIGAPEEQETAEEEKGGEDLTQS